MAKMPKDDARPGRIKQLRAVAQLVHQTNPRALPTVGLAALATVVVFVLVGVFTHAVLFTVPLGVLSGIVVGLILFGRQAERAQYAMLEGQPGAAAAVLQSLRGNWTVTPAVAANRNMDVVHRAVGRPGVVLVGEGSPSRLAGLIAAEKKRVARVAYDVPIYDIQVGNAEGQTPLPKLQRQIMKLPRNLKNPMVAELNYRLKALPQTVQMPKGPLPKGVRLPKGPRPRMR